MSIQLPQRFLRRTVLLQLSLREHQRQQRTGIISLQLYNIVI